MRVISKNKTYAIQWDGSDESAVEIGNAVNMLPVTVWEHPLYTGNLIAKGLLKLYKNNSSISPYLVLSPGDYLIYGDGILSRAINTTTFNQTFEECNEQ